MNINDQAKNQINDAIFSDWQNFRDQIGTENQANLRNHVLNVLIMPMINIKLPIEIQVRRYINEFQ